MVRVSFITFTRNCAKELEALLRHVVDVVDEIVVVDGMSTDATREVAESYGARVFVRKPRGFVEPDRMFALTKVSHDWVLYLDVDERLNAKLKGDLKDLIERKSREGYVALKTNSIVFVNGKPSLFKLPSYQIRIYNRYFVEYKGIVHELPIVRGQVAELDPYTYFIIHIKTSFRELFRKNLKYARLEKIQIYRRRNFVHRACVETRLAPIAFPLIIGERLVRNPPINSAGIPRALINALYHSLVAILMSLRSKEEERLAEFIQKHGIIELLERTSSNKAKKPSEENV